MIDPRLKAQCLDKVGRCPNHIAPELDNAPLTDVGNAARFVKRNGADLRYCHAWGCWLAWSRMQWQRDSTGQTVELAKETVQEMKERASEITDSDRQANYRKFATRSQSRERIKAMLELAKSDPSIATKPEQFDSDPWLLNCLSGTIELRTGRLRPHSRNDLITKIVHSEYDPNRHPVKWLSFLRLATDGDNDLIGYVQRAMGMTLTGDTSAKAVFIVFGAGSNGKTVFMTIFQECLGDYAKAAEPETFMPKAAGAINNDVARLQGARLVCTSELDEGSRLNEALIKRMSGGNKLIARFLHAEHVEFDPQFKIFMETNHKPIVRGGDPAVWSRLKLVPFDVNIPAKLKPHEQKSRTEVLDELRAELPGILGWAVQGCRDWMEGGLNEPDKVRLATQRYATDMDTLASFVADCCTLDRDAQVRTAFLFRHYKEWCVDNNERPMSQKAFSMRMVERGFEKRPDRFGYPEFRGIGLCADVSTIEHFEEDVRVESFGLR